MARGNLDILKELIKITHGEDLTDKQAEDIMIRIEGAHLDDVLGGKYTDEKAKDGKDNDA